MKITLSKSQWEHIGKTAGWIRIAKFGDSVKKKYLQQGIDEHIINSYINQFNEIRKAKTKLLFQEIPGVNVPIQQRQNIDAYKNFQELTNVVDYVNANKQKKQNINHKEDENKNIISEEDNLIISRADKPQEAISAKGKWNYNWCVADESNNMFYYYRYNEEQPTFYFIEDPEMPTENKYHIFVLIVTPYEYKVVSNENEGNGIPMEWNQIEEIQPKLKGKESLFKHIPVSKEEQEKYKNFQSISSEEFSFLPHEDKKLYIDMFSHEDVINYETFKLLPDELKLYAINRNIYIDKNMFDIIKNNNQLKNRSIEVLKRKILNNPLYYEYAPREMQKDPKIQEAHLNVDTWLHYLENHYNYEKIPNYNRCPPEIQKHPDIQQFMIDKLTQIMKDSPVNYKYIPDEFKNHPEIQKEYKNIEKWINIISVYNYQYMPYEFKNHPEIQIKYRNEWIKHIEVNGDSFDRCPDEFKNLPEIQKARLKYWTKRIIYKPDAYNNECPDELKTHPDIQEARVKSIAKVIEQKPWIYKTFCPDELKNHPYILQTYKNKQNWVQFLKENKENIMIYLHAYSSFAPKEIINNTEIKQICIDYLIKVINQNPKFYKTHVPDEFKNEPQIIAALPNEYKQELGITASNKNVIYINSNFYGIL
jgi:hypothetical protein